MAAVALQTTEREHRRTKKSDVPSKVRSLTATYLRGEIALVYARWRDD